MKLINILFLSLFFVYSLAATTTKTIPDSLLSKNTTKTLPIVNAISKTLPIANVTSKTLPVNNVTTKTLPVNNVTSKTLPIANATSKTLPIANTIPITITTTSSNTSVQTNSSDYYYSCGAQDWDCKTQKSNECYATLNQCWTQPWDSSLPEKCNAINAVCAKIWS
ncbi:hypothetical protein H8356DRAFT_1316537 [Neocallimastix lanati (nom. inval.)]|nr:hypothetical protein H8356DRAFT_1316537 [Neocallimastix sp. JGI-2020a]